MTFNFNLHYSDCHKNRNHKLSINHKLEFSSTLAVYIVYYIFNYINIIVKSFCSLPLFFFPPMPCLFFSNCASSDKYCFYFYLYSNGTEAQRVPSTLIDDETSAVQQSAVSLPPSPLLSGHSVSLALSTSTCAC